MNRSNTVTPSNPDTGAFGILFDKNMRCCYRESGCGAGRSVLREVETCRRRLASVSAKHTSDLCLTLMARENDTVKVDQMWWGQSDITALSASLFLVSSVTVVWSTAHTDQGTKMTILQAYFFFKK